jgi:cold shock CspA family protein
MEPEEPKDARLGILKSFSVVQGFGFITGEDIMTEFSRDVYLDRAQLASEWRLGQIVEFQTTLNSRGHPQARNLNWDPVPMLPGGKLRSVESAGLRSLNRILVSLRSDVETALRLSMDLSGKAEGIDFLSFTLDRVPTGTLTSLEVRLSLLLLLRLSRLLMDHARLLADQRRRQLVEWCEALEPSFKQSSDRLGDNFVLTSTQVRTNLMEACESCSDLEDVKFVESLQQLRKSFET